MDADVPHEEIMRALNDVVERGWVRYIGASSVSMSLNHSENELTRGARCLPGSSRCFRTWLKNMAGTNLLVCRTTTTCFTERKSAR